jgi:hypothetical protein
MQYQHPMRRFIFTRHRGGMVDVFITAGGFSVCICEGATAARADAEVAHAQKLLGALVSDHALANLENKNQ